MWSRGASLSTFVAVVAAMASMPAAADAAEYVVTRTDDSLAGPCVAGDCSLRAAILKANSEPGADTIAVPPGTYTLSIARTIPHFPDSWKGDLDVTESVRIENTGSAPARIDANGPAVLDRALEIHAGATVLHDITVSRGQAPLDSTTNEARGGGIYVRGDSQVTATLVMFGGGVQANGTVDTSVTGGVASGGGIYNDGETRLSGVDVASNGAAGGFGGGIATGAGGLTVLTDSMLRLNRAGVGGGASVRLGEFRAFASRIGRNEASFDTPNGIGGAAWVNDGTLELANTTLDNNSAQKQGGAIRAQDNVTGSTVKLDSATITGNRAANGGGISVNDGPGGIVTTVSLKNTILAKNLDSDVANGVIPDCEDESGGLIHSNGYNLVGNVNGCGGFTGTGDQVGTINAPIDPKLGPDGLHGGPFGVFTVPLKPASPAVDAGAPDCFSEDARTVDRDLGGRCDIGAYELVRCSGVIVNRVGTDSDDGPASAFLDPTEAADGYLGLAGNDALGGGVGNDGLCGGAGDDTLKGGEGNDMLKGGSGNDRCVGGPGKDKATGCEIQRSIP